MLRRVYMQFISIRQGVTGPVPAETIQDYERQLDRLDGIGEDVEEFHIREADWHFDTRILDPAGGIASTSTCPPTGNEPRVVSQSRFALRFGPAFSFVQRLVFEAERPKELSVPKSRDEIIQSRDEVLSTLIAAYLKDQTVIHVRGGDGRHIFLHPGIPRDYEPEWTHVEALANEGKLILNKESQKSTWAINIPSDTLRTVQQQAPEAVSKLRSGDVDREAQGQQMIFNIVNGGVGNFSTAGLNATQNISHGVSLEELHHLFADLQKLGVPEAAIVDLGARIENEADPALRGPKVLGWLGAFTSQVASGSIGGVMANSLPAITTAVLAYINHLG